MIDNGCMHLLHAAGSACMQITTIICIIVGIYYLSIWPSKNYRGGVGVDPLEQWAVSLEKCQIRIGGRFSTIPNRYIRLGSVSTGDLLVLRTTASLAD